MSMPSGSLLIAGDPQRIKEEKKMAPPSTARSIKSRTVKARVEG